MVHTGGSRFPVCDQRLNRIARLEGAIDVRDVAVGDVDGDEDRAGFDFAFDRLGQILDGRRQRSGPTISCLRRGRRLRRARRTVARQPRSGPYPAAPSRWLQAPDHSARPARPRSVNPRDRRQESRPSGAPAALLRRGCGQQRRSVRARRPRREARAQLPQLRWGLGTRPER